MTLRLGVSDSQVEGGTIHQEGSKGRRNSLGGHAECVVWSVSEGNRGGGLG